MKYTFKYINSQLRYEPDSGLLFWKIGRSGRLKNKLTAGCKNSEGYLHIKINGHLFKSHRIAWLLSTGKWPKNQIDHINRIRYDNRLINLREATNKENARNHIVHYKNTSGFSGVSYANDRKKWRAYITIFYKRKYVGEFLSKNGAIHARKCAEEKYFNEFSPSK